MEVRKRGQLNGDQEKTVGIDKFSTGYEKMEETGLGLPPGVQNYELTDGHDDDDICELNINRLS